MIENELLGSVWSQHGKSTIVVCAWRVTSTVAVDARAPIRAVYRARHHLIVYVREGIDSGLETVEFRYWVNGITHALSCKTNEIDAAMI